MTGEPLRIVDYERRARVEAWLSALLMTLWFATIALIMLGVVGGVAALAAVIALFVGWTFPWPTIAGIVAALSAVGMAYTVVRWGRMIRGLSKRDLFLAELALAADLRGAHIDVIDVLDGYGPKRSRFGRVRRVWLMIGSTRDRWDDIQELRQLRPFLPGALTATWWWTGTMIVLVLIWIVTAIAAAIAYAL